MEYGFFESFDKYQEARDEFMSMKQITPLNCGDVIKSCLETVKKAREDILLYERTKHLFQFLKPEKYPEFIRPQKKEQIHVLSPKILQYNEISPIFMQHISILINYIHSNPEMFAKGVLERANKKDFPYIVNALIPTIYGFFVSQEYFTNAFVLYAHIIRLSKPAVCLQILSPYFCSIGTFRFIEHIMSRFALKLQNEVGFDNPQKLPLLIPVFVQILGDMIIDARKLLPSQLKMILYGCKNQKWPPEDLITLFFHKFFIPMAIHWSEASTCSPYTDLLKQIIDNLLTTDQMAISIINKIIHENMFADLPSFYLSFRQEYRMYLLSHADAEYAVRIIKQVVELPITLTELSKHEVPPDERHRPFFSCVYPKNQKLLNQKFRPLLFPSNTKYIVPDNPDNERLVRELQSRAPPNKTVFEVIENTNDVNLKTYSLLHSISDISKQQENFEVFIWFAVHKNIIMEWQKVSLRSHECTLLPLAHKIMKNMNPLTIEATIDLMSKTIGTTNMKRNIFMFMIIPKIHEAREKVTKQFNQMTERWRIFITSELKNVDHGFLDKRSNIVKEHFWDAVEYIKSVNRVPASLALDVINSAVRRIHVISRDKDELAFLLNMMAVLSQFKQLLEVFLLVNEIVVKNSVFTKMMTDEEMRYWTSIERYILNITSRDPFMQKTYIKLQSILK